MPKVAADVDGTVLRMPWATKEEFKCELSLWMTFCVSFRGSGSPAVFLLVCTLYYGKTKALILYLLSRVTVLYKGNPNDG